ncbi:MAG TPA: hypothetical protein VHC22_17730 [Pirellulales bacterium]|nr:hypothetical protein [Pirellulales bacterium]
MTDERLIELIDERSPEELSAAEVAEIRARLKESPALREALAGRLRLEQALHQSVAQFRLPIELLLAKAAAIQATSTVAKLLGWGSTTALMIGVSVGTLVALRGEAPNPPAIAQRVVDEPTSPSDEPADTLLVNGFDDGQKAMVGTPLGIPVPPAAAPPNPRDELYFADDADAAAWRSSLETVAGDVSQRTVDNRPELVLRGLQVLRHAWPATGRMRLQLVDHDRFKIHLSHTAGDPLGTAGANRPAGPSSVTLEFFAQPRPLWAAWLAARRANQPLPERLALAAHDDGQLARLGAATIDVGYREGRIVLSHGETELLAAPFSGLPDWIVFEGDAVLHGLEFADGAVAAARPLDAPAVVGVPADRDWQHELPEGAKWTVLPAGRVELLAEDSQADAHARCLTGGELREVCFELEDPLPGTGVYLCGDQGSAAYRLAFVPGDGPDQVCFTLTSQETSLVQLPEGPAPLCPARVWFRLVSAAGMLRAWFSCDGTCWSPVLGPALPVAAPLSTVGVYCLPGPGTRSIRMAHLTVTGPADRAIEPTTELFGRRSFGPRPFLLVEFASKLGQP